MSESLLVTAASRGVSCEQQMKLALMEIKSRGGRATFPEICARINAELGIYRLSRSGKAILREIVSGRGVRRGFIRKGEDGNWEITKGGSEFLKSGGPKEAMGLVNLAAEIWDNVRNFGCEPLEQQRKIPTKKYFVYDPISGWVAPAKLAGLVDMSIERYLSVDKDAPPGEFDGHRTRKAIEAAGLCETSAAIPKQCLENWLKDMGKQIQDPVLYSRRGLADQKSNLEQFREALREMRRAEGGTAAHKPLLLLAALSSPKPTFEGIREIYAQLAEAIDLPDNVSQPYPRLNQRSAEAGWFYRIVNEEGVYQTPEPGALGPLRGTRIEWNPEYIPCLEDYRIREAAEEAILQLLSAEDRKRVEAVLERLDGELPEPVERELTWSALVQGFAAALSQAGLNFGQRHEELARTFLVSLATKRLVILTGLSGSGKTQIALKLGEWLGQMEVISVRPDWTGPEYLLGYEDALLPAVEGRRCWHVPRALEFILEAAKDPQQPYLLVLDEMNLAHVERYFADILSGMESAQPCLPHLTKNAQGYWLADPVEPRIALPANLFIAGTVNVDETTYMFSPKVLDRANTIEFRVRSEDLNPSIRKPQSCKAAPDGWARQFLNLALAPEWPPLPNQEQLVSWLKRLHELLMPAGFEFGHRVFFEILRFAALYQASAGRSPEDALDLQIMQKILPRLHGSRRKVEKTLTDLQKFCNEVGPLQLSGDKIQRMLENLHANQFTSFTD
jgi:hypothetical protein